MHFPYCHLKNLIHIPSINTKSYGNISIKYHCAKLWNEFFKTGITINSDRKKNVFLDNIKSSQHFKKVLKKHLLYMYSLEDDDYNFDLLYTY